MTRPSSDILIIGGGIIGLMSARELLKNGARVRILERQGTGRESSWAGGGILSPLYPWRAPEPINRLFAWSHREYPDWMAQLKAETGLDPEWQRSGMWVADGDAERQAAANWMDTFGFTGQWLRAAEARPLEPAVRWQDCNPLYLPDIAQVRNPRLLAAVRQDVLRLGGIIHEHTPVTRLIDDGQRIGGVEASGAIYNADTYVLAAGAWSAQLAATDGGEPSLLPIEPVKGQMLIFTARPGTLNRMLLCGGHYLIPRRDGRILVGSTLEYTGFDKSTTEAAAGQLVAFARHWLPETTLTLEKHWAGLRPGSPTGVPYISQHPHRTNLYLNCGHFRNGFVMAPASARLLSELIQNRPPFTNAEAYRYGRSEAVHAIPGQPTPHGSGTCSHRN